MDAHAEPPAPKRQDTTVGSGIDFSDPNSKLAPLYLRTTGVIFAAALAILVVFYSHFPLYHADVWTHLKHGTYIVETGRFSGPEPYSPFADPAARRPAFYWLSQVTYHALFRTGELLAGGDETRRFAGGSELLRQGHVLTVVGVHVVFWVAYRRLTSSGSLALLGLTLFFGAANSSIGVYRPQIFAFLWFGILYAMLVKPVCARTLLIAVPLLFVLWVNTHGSYPMGFMLIGLFAAGRVWDAGPVAAFKSREWRTLVWAGFLAAVALTVFNPDGPATWPVVFSFAGQPNLKLLMEWQPLNFSEAKGGHYLYWASFILLVALQWIGPRRFNGAELLQICTFGVAPLFQQRFMAWWLPLCIGIALNHLNEIAAERGWVWSRSTPSFRKTLFASILFVIGLAFTPLAKWAQDDRPADAMEILHPGTPYGLAETLRGKPGGERFAPLEAELKKHFAGKPIGPIFCSETVGEFLYWRGLPDSPPMRNTHAHLYTPQFFDPCFNLKSALPGWWEFLDRYGVNIVVLEPLQPDLQPLPLVVELSKRPDWTVVLDERNRADIRDPKAKLFVAIRKTPLHP